ncbi:unnamed protein product [Ilex paraguariensis]|uniref:Uncharacterized protein n=1 Tax=Ilex paraguariensis TaxID=185542 RepID=A0ABC8SSK7_9AQUA
MVPTKSKPQLSTATVRESEEDKIEIAQRKSTDPVHHWAFLDEIDAPMWADLTLEAKSTFQDKDDEWFHIIHPFHQCSSRQLISAFHHIGEGFKNSEIGNQGPSSPELPPSVSRSRGKYHRNKECGQHNRRVTSNKSHLVKKLCSKSSGVNAGSGKEVKLKSSYRTSKGKAGLEVSSVGVSSLAETKGPRNQWDPKPRSSSLAIRSNSTSTIASESSLTETAGPNFSEPILSCGDSRVYSGALAIKEDKNNSTSTITSESSDQHQQNSLEVSSHLFGRTSGLLSTLKISLRKSCVTRQASRVEINGGRKSEGRRSYSSKSSVGSSSNPGYDVENQTFAAKQIRDQTPDSKNAVTISRALKQKVQLPDVCKAPPFQANNMTLSSKSQDETIVPKSTNGETAKSKVQNHTVRPRVLVRRSVNKHDPLPAVTKAKDKMGVDCGKRLAGGGKENAVGRLSVTQKSSMREKVAEGVVMKRNVPQKSDRTKPIGPKVHMSTIAIEAWSIVVH